MRIKIWIILSFFYLNSICYADILFVGNKATVPADLKKKDIEMIYLGKLKNWDNKIKISPVILTHRESFEALLGQYLGRPKSNFTNYWRRMVFNGRGAAPIAFRNEEQVVRYVSIHEGAIGFVTENFKFSKDDEAYVSIIHIIDGE